VHDVDALLERALGEGRDEVVARWPHVVADEDPRGVGELGERHAQRLGDLLVELLGHGAADVVGLHDVVESAHGGWRS